MQNNLELLEYKIKNLDILWQHNNETIYINSFIEKLVDILKLYTDDYNSYSNILYNIIYPRNKDMITMDIYNKTIEYLGHPDTWISKLDFIKELSNYAIFNSFLDTSLENLENNCFIISFDPQDLNIIVVKTKDKEYLYDIRNYIYKDLETGLTYNFFSDILKDLKTKKNLKFGLIKDF